MENSVDLKRKTINSRGIELSGKPSADLPHLHYFPEGAADTPLPKMTLYENLYTHNEKFIKSTAIEFFGNKITYEKLFEMIDKTAKAFYASGVRKGDTVSVVMATIPELVYTIFALNKLGVKTDITHFLLEDEEDIYKVVKRANPNMMVIMDNFYGKFKNVIDKLPIDSIITTSVVNSASLPVRILKNSEMKKAVKDGKMVGIPGNDPRFQTWNEFIKSTPKGTAYPIAPYEENRDIIGVSSSGTTGFPKGVNLSDDGINANILSHEVSGDTWSTRNIRYLNILPSIFATTITSSLVYPLVLGSTLILDPRFDAKIFADQIKKYKPSCTVVNTTHWGSLLNNHKLKGIDLSFLQMPICGGEALPIELEKSLNSMFREHTPEGKIPPRMRKGWGLSEFGAAVTLTHNYAYECETKLGSVGKAFPHFRIGIFNPDTNKELGYHELGEIRVNSPSRMIGYDQDVEATDEVFQINPHDNVEWGRSFDIGHIDEDGEVFIDGPRGIDDAVNNDDNELIYAFPIDRIFHSDSRIEYCKTVGRKVFDETTGKEKQIHVTHIKLSDGMNKEEMLMEIHNACVNNLPANSRPFAYKIRDTIPQGSSGKKDVGAMRLDGEGLVRITDEGIFDVSIDNSNMPTYTLIT